jgi:hypothetical protein
MSEDVYNEKTFLGMVFSDAKRLCENIDKNLSFIEIIELLNKNNIIDDNIIDKEYIENNEDNIECDIEIKDNELVTVNNITWINNIIKNKYNNSPYRVPLRNNKNIIVEYTLVDKENYLNIIKFRCFLSEEGYAIASYGNYTLKIHHIVFKKPKRGFVIDHKNRDKLLNIKYNLHEVTKPQNSQNTVKNIENTTSKYIGVTFRNDSNKYRAICQRQNLGSFVKAVEAAKAYDRYSFKVYGKYANNNKLVKYEEIINIDINDLMVKKKKRTLPVNIVFHNNLYVAIKYHKLIKYEGLYRKTLIESTNDLIDINIKINRIKVYEELVHMQKPITRNNDGIAFIKTKNKKHEFDVLVNDDLWHKYSMVSWTITPKKYIYNAQFGYMHRNVMNAKDDELIDHINHIKYDNLSTNLRVSTDTNNSHNKKKSINATSKYYGVHYITKTRKWGASIKKYYIRYNIGKFNNEIDAAKAYNIKAVELYGDFANINKF